MSQEVKDAVFGNVGSIVAFRMGVDDARSMQRYFEPRFLEYDLVHMHNRHFVISMTIEGEKIPGFSAISLNLPPDGDDYTPHIIERSRTQYAVSRDYVDRYVGERYLLQEAPKAVPQPKPEKPKTQPGSGAFPAKPGAAPQPKPAAKKTRQTSPRTLGRAALKLPLMSSDKPKRKRKRSRKKKSDQTSLQIRH